MKTKDILYPFAGGLDLGCGYRLLHSPLKKKELKHIEDNLQDFANNFIAPTEIPLNKSLFNHFLNRNYSELAQFFANHGIQSTLLKNKNEGLFHHLKSDSFLKAWGTIAVGNHFIELREVDGIYNHSIAQKLNLREGDILPHIHSGSGKSIEREFLLYMAKFIQQFKEDNALISEYNGYEIKVDYQNPLAHSFIEDTLDSMQFSMFNRSLLAYKLQPWFHDQLVDLFDTPHDSIELEGDVITTQKGIQKYSTVNQEEIAIIPSAINDVSYLVKRKGIHPYINHGTGEGVGGKSPDFYGVITNLQNPINRKYHSAETIINYCQEVGLIEVIATLKPWISIKNEGGKI